MTIRELFEYMRKLPDWDSEVKIMYKGVLKLRNSAGVGDFSGDLYLFGEYDSSNTKEAVDVLSPEI